MLHLMIAGRLHWHAMGSKTRIRPALLYLEFENGTLTLTEAGTKRRASLHVVANEAQLTEHDRGGLEPLEATAEEFRERVSERNHTLKRALTDPTILSGVGNAYSDEILHRARLSPLAQTKQLDDRQWQQLFEATRAVLVEWTSRLRADAAEHFPEKVTAFREGMAVHGRYGKPCPVCSTAIQRIRYAENETNYCPRCQTGGKLLADRSLSRLLKDDWPKTIETLEYQRVPRKKSQKRHSHDGAATLFCTYSPAPPLDRFVQDIWYWEGPQQAHAMERLMPTGTATIIINLLEDEVREYAGARGQVVHRHPGAILVGARSSYSIIDTAEQRTVIGLGFRPGGTWPFFDVAGDELRNQHAELEDIWGARARSLRERILLAPTPIARLRTLEQELLACAVRPLTRSIPRLRARWAACIAATRWRRWKS